MVKKFLTVVFLLCFVAVIPAAAEDKTEDEKTAREDTKSGNNDKEENPKEAEYTAAVENKSQTDSSFHSISKYNFLFYMVYTVKYGDVGSSTESVPVVAEE